MIVNPYATTMSVRLKQLVVYALQGRYEVEAVDTQRKGHAIELCREAARRGLRRRRRVRRRRHGQRGGQRARRLAHRAHLPAGRRDQRLLPHARHPDRRRRRDRAPAPARRRLGAAPRRPRPRQRPLVHVLRRRRARRHGRRARRPPPAPEGALRPLVLRAGRGRRRSCEKYVVNPPQVVATAGGEETQRRQRVRPERAALHVLPHAARSTSSDGAALDSGDLSGVVLTRANALDVPTIAYRLLAERARGRRPPPRARVRRARRPARALGRRPPGAGPGRRRLHRDARGGRLQRRAPAALRVLVASRRWA